MYVNIVSSSSKLHLVTFQVNLCSDAIYLLDAFDGVYVYYASDDPTHPFPPPLDSMFWVMFFTDFPLARSDFSSPNYVCFSHVRGFPTKRCSSQRS